MRVSGPLAGTPGQPYLRRARLTPGTRDTCPSTAPMRAASLTTTVKVIHAVHPRLS